jgi:hypothetical protein
MIPARLRAAGPWLVFPAVALALFPGALEDRSFFHYDTWMQNLAFRAWWFDELREGRFATWCPGMFAGFPLFAETQTGPLYPPTFLLFLLLPATAAFSASVLLHFALAGAGACFLARRLSSGWAGAITAGVAFEFSGFLVTHVVHFNLLVGAALAPWAAAFAWDAAAGRARPALALAGTLALSLAGAHPYATIMSLALAAGMMLGRSASVRSATRGVAVLLAAAVLGAGIAAVQVLPARELIARTPRAGAADWDFLTFGSLPPWQLATLAAPDLYGTPVDGTFHGGPDWSHFAETCSYAGILALGLAAVALVLRRDRATLCLSATAALSLLLMFGKYTPAYRALSWVPLLSSTRLPARWALLFTLALVTLAGLGVDALTRETAPRRRRALAVGASVMVLFAAAAWTLGEGARSPDGWVAETGRFWPERLASISRAAEAGSIRLVAVLGLSMAAAGLLALRRVPRAAAFAPAAVLAADLGSWGASFNPMIPAAWISEPPPLVAALPRTEPRPRVFRQGVDELWVRRPGAPRADLFTPAWKGNEASYRSGAWTLPPNSGLLYGVDSGEGFTSLPPAQWLEWTGLDGAPGAAPRAELSEAQADLLAVDAVISTGSGIAGAGWEAKSLPGDVWVSRNADPLPRARLAASWETADRADVLRRVRGEDHDPRRAVLLETAPPGLPAAEQRGPADAALPARENGAGRWDVDVPAGARGIVVVAESWDPDWKARAPGESEVPVFRADGLFAAFVAPASGGTVELRHEPRSVTTGAVISLVSLLAWGALFAAAGRRPAIGLVPEPGPGGALRNALPFAAVLAVVLISFAANAGDARGDLAASGLRGEAARAWVDEAFAARRAGALDDALRLLEAAQRLRPDDAAIQRRIELVKEEIAGGR